MSLISSKGFFRTR